MFRTLLSLLDDESIRTRIVATANNLCKAYTDASANLDASFEEEGDNYVFVLNVPKDTTSADVNVEYDDETNAVSVEISREGEKYSTKMVYVETLPANADPDTLSATVTNGVFTLIVDKLPEPVESEPVCEAVVDPIVVAVKRKNRK